jgi:hypothetical protein
MSAIYYCDRCGNKLTDNEISCIANLRREQETETIGIVLVQIGKTIDLCASCEAGLRIWWYESNFKKEAK